VSDRTTAQKQIGMGSGPTNFWKVMMQYKPYEDETGALDKRTWGKAIANDCD